MDILGVVILIIGVQLVIVMELLIASLVIEELLILPNVKVELVILHLQDKHFTSFIEEELIKKLSKVMSFVKVEHVIILTIIMGQEHLIASFVNFVKVILVVITYFVKAFIEIIIITTNLIDSIDFDFIKINDFRPFN